MNDLDIEALREEILGYIVAYCKQNKEKQMICNNRKIDLADRLKDEFPSIRCKEDKNGDIRVFLGYKEIFLRSDWADKPCINLNNPFFSFLGFVFYDWTCEIKTKADLGKIMTPLLESEILGLRKSKE